MGPRRSHPKQDLLDPGDIGVGSFSERRLARELGHDDDVTAARKLGGNQVPGAVMIGFAALTVQEGDQRVAPATVQDLRVLRRAVGAREEDPDTTR